MTYQLPHPANELWRRTRPDRFTLPHPEELSREFTFHATGAEVSGIHVLPLKEGLKFLSGRSTGIPSVRLSESGLSALIHAEARIGYVLIVESGLSPEKPVEISLSVPSGQYHAMRCVVLIGEGSRVVLSESLSGGENGQLLAASFLHLGSDSSLTFRRQWTPSGTAFSVADRKSVV